MMECMRKRGGAGMSDFTRRACGGFEAALADDSAIIYYFNSVDATGVPRDVLESVTALYMHGYAPDVGLIDMLPNVSYVYSTSLCVGPAYYAVCKKGGHDGSAERPWPREIDEVEWDSGEDAFVVNLRGTPPRLKSDAPHRMRHRARKRTRARCARAGGKPVMCGHGSPSARPDTIAV